MRSFIYTALLVMAAGTRASIGAQSIELGGLFGWYQPLADFRFGSIQSTDLPASARDLHGIAWGGDARLALGKRAAVEAIVESATSTTPGCACPGGYILPPTTERVTLAAVEGLYRVPLGGTNEFSFGGGPAMIQHGGDGYGRYGSPKSWGGVGSVEIGHAVNSHLEAAARVLGAAYSFRLDFPPQSGPQFDLLVSLGVRWRFRAGSSNDP